LKYVKHIQFNKIEKYLLSNVIHSQDMKEKKGICIVSIKISNKNLVFSSYKMYFRGNIVNFHWLSVYLC